MTHEPARIITLTTAAAGATINVVALVADWSGELVAGLNLAVAGWIAVAGEIIRSRVRPV